MPKEPERLEIDIQKIFLTPPTSMREKITLFLMMLVIFIMCFGPTIFTDISPVRASPKGCPMNQDQGYL